MILHPGVITALKRLVGDELDVARLMVAGEVSSPQHLGTLTLFAVRVTGTGLAYRQGLAEHVWRNPANYLNDDFLARCNGLPVLWEHPEGSTMQGDDFAERAIGTVFMPYISGDEVWAIARIYDERAAKLMEDGQLSTSPSVIFRDPTVNDKLSSEDGRSILFEGKPSLLDHLAVCERGVWDKGGDPTGVRSDNEKVKTMADENEDKGQDGDKLDKVLEHLNGLTGGMKDMSARLDALESKKADAKDDEASEEEKLAAARKEQERADSHGRGPRILTNAEEAALAKTQSRADTAWNLHGKRAPAPMVGETHINYRVRLANDLKKFSPTLEKVNLGAIAKGDEPGFAILEDQIYADSEKEASKPTIFLDDSIKSRTRWDKEMQRNITEWHGPHTFAKEIGIQARPVLAINTPSNNPRAFGL